MLCGRKLARSNEVSPCFWAATTAKEYSKLTASRSPRFGYRLPPRYIKHLNWSTPIGFILWILFAGGHKTTDKNYINKMPSRGGYAAAASALLALSSVSSFGKYLLEGLLWGYSNAWLGVNEEVCVWQHWRRKLCRDWIGGQLVRVHMHHVVSIGDIKWWHSVGTSATNHLGGDTHYVVPNWTYQPNWTCQP